MPIGDPRGEFLVILATEAVVDDVFMAVIRFVRIVGQFCYTHIITLQ